MDAGQGDGAILIAPSGETVMFDKRHRPGGASLAFQVQRQLLSQEQIVGAELGMTGSPTVSAR